MTVNVTPQKNAIVTVTSPVEVWVKGENTNLTTMLSPGQWVCTEQERTDNKGQVYWVIRTMRVML